MASIQLEEDISIDDFDFGEFYKYSAKSLASYQRPLFLRFQESIGETSTFKLKKTDLKKQGFDPSSIDDPLFFIDTAAQTYTPLDAALYESIQSGKTRV
mmetsp:Transcript_32787/g.40275  ORF Transcript_32787/g.40275 Transcript_32787/m.40275 type:complete len:99 (+) Transcript_32787:162-458(+)